MKHALLFTGHMIDAPDRKTPRFPAAKEAAAAAAISSWLKQKQSETAVPLSGIAGGACGGDILFHEACRELGIPTEVYLALPEADFIKASVAFAGQDWLDRFNRVCSEVPVHILPGRPDDDAVWERANARMLQAALAAGNGGTTLLALWDGKDGDGPGGTADMICAARKEGADAVVIAPDSL